MRARSPARQVPVVVHLVMVISLSAGSGLRAETVTLRPVADASVHEISPANNMGGHTHVAAGSTGQAGSRSRGLFRFDLQDAVPTNAVILSASLFLRVTGTPGPGGADSTFALHRIQRAWGEGNKVGNLGSAATDGEVTWTARFTPTDLWSVPGGAAPADYVAEPSSTVFVADIGGYTFESTPRLAGDVQAWADDPASNFGWILISQSEEVPRTARRIGSREAGASASMLMIEYMTQTVVQPPVMTQIGLAGGQMFFQFSAQAQTPYTIEFNGAMGSTNWLTFTDVPPQPAATNVLITDSTAAEQRFYRVRSP